MILEVLLYLVLGSFIIFMMSRLDIIGPPEQIQGWWIILLIGVWLFWPLYLLELVVSLYLLGIVEMGKKSQKETD